MKRACQNLTHKGMTNSVPIVIGIHVTIKNQIKINT